MSASAPPWRRCGRSATWPASRTQPRRMIRPWSTSTPPRSSRSRGARRTTACSSWSSFSSTLRARRDAPTIWFEHRPAVIASYVSRLRGFITHGVQRICQARHRDLDFSRNRCAAPGPWRRSLRGSWALAHDVRFGGSRIRGSAARSAGSPKRRGSSTAVRTLAPVDAVLRGAMHELATRPVAVGCGDARELSFGYGGGPC